MEPKSIYVAQKQKKSWFNDAKKDEMKAFVGALFFMAIHRQPNFEHYFSRDCSCNTKCFYQKQILAAVAEVLFDWQFNESYDKLYKLRPIINVMNEKFKQVYNIVSGGGGG